MQRAEQGHEDHGQHGRGRQRHEGHGHGGPGEGGRGGPGAVRGGAGGGGRGGAGHVHGQQGNGDHGDHGDRAGGAGPGAGDGADGGPRDGVYDVVVVGGGAAGLSGALALARARRSVLVVDAGEPRNAPSGHVHNFLTRDGTPPAELAAAGRAEVTRYGGRIVDGRVTAVAKDGDGFLVTPADGDPVRARRLLLATGLADRLPDLPGLADHWGGDVLHCPYCHGWEVRDLRVGILATGPLAWHQAELWRQWTPHVLVLRHGAPVPVPEQAERLAARGIFVVDGPVAALERDAEGRLTGVRTVPGETVALDALVVATSLDAHVELAESLGLEVVDVAVAGSVIGSQVAADALGATDVPGVWVAGNVADVQAQVVTAAAMGLKAGAAINADLVAEDTRAAVGVYRERIGETFSKEGWEERYRAKSALWSGRPNPQLVAEVAALEPGRALDVGCGEGADALWLAGRGWRVTAVDISATALERAAAHVAEAGAEVAERIVFTRADLLEEPPAEGAYELVSAQFMQLPGELRTEMFRRLGAAVAPGGTLLVVGHHPWDLRSGAGPRLFPDMLYTPEAVVAGLDPAEWDVRVCESRPRTVQDADGNDATLHDAVVVARRRGAGDGA
ncbi:bifunctional NAD(P)/FAD-dependent oxidoreductase/class I SAM-dependent methyltransferase [Streptomyces sp. NRRL S-87]|uniref:bifunctional NAD(P)/FAD-dependent oxidoreductase/class I SAM-dependent methyltransferase n=1 Tax=Streptomyces sp. NRRL S-87 TaxID=1463920 RepID=UPI000A8EF52D|nr:bifunctional NAD(P)/FAD-dependent oxidoreductase/class I SAM-dependent methyltransferase [Streptomyces sp. NRRL S-87]